MGHRCPHDLAEGFDQRLTVRLGMRYGANHQSIEQQDQDFFARSQLCFTETGSDTPPQAPTQLTLPRIGTGDDIGGTRIACRLRQYVQRQTGLVQVKLMGERRLHDS